MTTTLNLRSESLAGGRVKGVMVRAHLQFVRDRLGEQALEATMKRSEEHTSELQSPQ